MQKVPIKKGYPFRMTGPPAPTLSVLSDPEHIAVLPAKIPHIRPRINVSEGDAVSIGSLLFEDKRNPAFKFLSPAGGNISEIVFGPRRAVEAIVVKRRQQDEPRNAFPAFSGAQLDDMARSDLVHHIIDGGLWWTLRQLPFRKLCPLDSAPPLILVGLNAIEPFLPAPEVYLDGRYDLLAYGIQVLNKLSRNRVHVFASADQHALLAQCKPYLTHTVSGHYPADDPGTVLYHIKQSAEQNRAWYISGQDLLLLAQLLQQGQYPIERVVSVGGSAAPLRRHFLTRMGVPFSHLVDIAALQADTRFVMGGLLRGHSSSPDGYMGLYETALNLVPEGNRAEFLALFNPGLRHPSFSRCFLSKLSARPPIYHCNLNGSVRPCIACMHCADVCPVDILPQMAYKALLTDEVEEALALGLLDCVECGLCSYVCPSKIELSQTLIGGKAAYARDTEVESTS